MTPAIPDPRAGRSWQQLLAAPSFIELDAFSRAAALVDDSDLRVLIGPFDRIESPWLAMQGLTPQSDDGIVIGRGSIAGQPVVIIAIEQDFQGGAIGEVSGAKISQALSLAATDSRNGSPTPAVILFESGGVRLQEANLGLNAVAEICSALLDLRPHAPVVGVIAGTVGCFGGTSIVAGLCTHLVVTPQARLGLNGPAVIEQEAGIAEFDSQNRELVWDVTGGHQRTAEGLADSLVPDDATAIRAAVTKTLRAGVLADDGYRSRRLDQLTLRTTARQPKPSAAADSTAESRGRTWLTALTEGHDAEHVIASVLHTDTTMAHYLAVVPDPRNAFPRARHGEVGVTESLALARVISRIILADRANAEKRPVVAIVDVPSQAYGQTEERIGLHQTMAAAVDAYHRARTAGHPVIALVVGSALSGGFLTHGLQANRILALNDPNVEIHAMHRLAAARITLRTVAQLDELAGTVTPLSYNVTDWARLGLCDGLLRVSNAVRPTPGDVAAVHAALTSAIEHARTGSNDLSNRLDSPGAVELRRASREVRETMTRQWSLGCS